MEIRKVGVIGCGTMGAGICEVVARAGLPAAFVEVSPANLEAGTERIRRSLQRRVDAGRLDVAARDEILGRVVGDVSYDVVADAELVIEAVPEQLARKQAVFRELDDVLGPEAILATNTSSLAITGIAVDTRRADRVIGFHFFNPAPAMALIELVTTVVTAPWVVETARRFAERIGKTPVTVKDRAGFIANLLLFPYLNQAVGMLESGYASPEDIDTAMQLGAGHPMGPIATLDLIGLDSATAIMERIFEEFGDTRHAPRPLLRHLMRAGYHGRKSGQGFYSYGAAGRPQTTTGSTDGAAPVETALVSGWSTAGVLGTGTMAAGIAEVCARAGYDTVIRGRSTEKAKDTVRMVTASLSKGVERGKLASDAAEAAGARLTVTAELDDLGDCDIVIEAVAEDLPLKRRLFAELDERAKRSALLATTTSSLPVIECAMATGRPERVVGIHFFNPANRMGLVEVVHTARTQAEALEQARAFAHALGKQPVVCRDRAGFIVNALLFPYLNDAVKMLEEGYATVADIDDAMHLGCGHPLGPFRLMDVVGLDVTLEICKALHAEFRTPGYAPAALLRHMVHAGYLGRKTGRGFHVYG